MKMRNTTIGTTPAGGAPPLERPREGHTHTQVQGRRHFETQSRETQPAERQSRAKGANTENEGKRRASKYGAAG